MNRITVICWLFLVAILFGSCWNVRKGKAFEHIAPGIWRGQFLFGEVKETEKKGVGQKEKYGGPKYTEKVPVMFEVRNSDNEKPIEIEFFNGKSSIQPDSLRFWGDTLYCYFQQSPKYLRLIYEVNLMEGLFLSDEKNEYPIKFQAQMLGGIAARFPDIYDAEIEGLDGNWNLELTGEDNNLVQAELTLETKEKQVFGHLISRDSSLLLDMDLEGIIQTDKLFLSSFDGEHVIHIKSSATKDGTLLNKGSLRVDNKSFYMEGKR